MIYLQPQLFITSNARSTFPNYNIFVVVVSVSQTYENKFAQIIDSGYSVWNYWPSIITHKHGRYLHSFNPKVYVSSTLFRTCTHTMYIEVFCHSDHHSPLTLTKSHRSFTLVVCTQSPYTKIYIGPWNTQACFIFYLYLAPYARNFNHENNSFCTLPNIKRTNYFVIRTIKRTQNALEFSGEQQHYIGNIAAKRDSLTTRQRWKWAFSTSDTTTLN